MTELKSNLEWNGKSGQKEIYFSSSHSTCPQGDLMTLSSIWNRLLLKRSCYFTQHFPQLMEFTATRCGDGQMGLKRLDKHILVLVYYYWL